MSINSIEYILYILVGMIIYYMLSKKAKLIFLLLLSIAFYSFWSIPNTVLLIASSLITFFFGIHCAPDGSERKENVPDKNAYSDTDEIKILPKNRNFSSSPVHGSRKKILTAGILFLLCELFIYKYLNFTVLQVNSVLRFFTQGISINIRRMILPLGISFYVFQSIGYLVDVYRGKTKAERNVLRFLLFITFFPKIIQGPIERSSGFLKQLEDIENRSSFNFHQIQNGMITILWGLFMKMVIADRIGIIVDNVFGRYFVYGTVELFFTSVCYTIQIYCDFAGYSAIAVGAGRLFGFDLIQNFDCPYFSGSLKEFWRRWHISLSQWFRDFVYIPLGGSRCTAFRKRLNIFLVMLVSGIWHGAGWTFIAWGVIHGFYQVIEDIITPFIRKLNRKIHVPSESVSYKIGNIFITFNLVNLAWIFFRAESIRVALDYIRIMFTNYNPWAFFSGSLLKLGLDQTEMNVLLAAIVILIIVELVQYKCRSSLAQMLQGQCFWFRWEVLILLITFTWVFGEYGPLFESSNFIYQGF